MKFTCSTVLIEPCLTSISMNSMEKIMCQIIILSPTQLGFRKQHSCSTALTNIIDNIMLVKTQYWRRLIFLKHLILWAIQCPYLSHTDWLRAQLSISNFLTNHNARRKHDFCSVHGHMWCSAGFSIGSASVCYLYFVYHESRGSLFGTIICRWHNCIFLQKIKKMKMYVRHWVKSLPI